MELAMTRRVCLLGGVVVLLFARGGAADGPKQVAADERKLQAAKLQHDGPALLEFFRKRTLTDLERANVEILIHKLGARAFRIREQAAAELVTRGPVVLELLREHLNNPDPEIARRAEKCIARIKDKDLPPDVAAAAARLLAERKPAGAVAALLAYLPYADSEGVADEVRNSLTALAVRGGKPAKALVDALADRNAVRRGAAAEALVRAGAKGERAAVEKLLKDPEPSVRFRTAMALTTAGERKGVPELIELLVPLPQALAWQAEDVLYRLAEGNSPPAVSLGAEAAARKECRDAWSKWWKEHGASVDLAKLREAPRLLGRTVIVLLDMGKVFEVDAENKVVWEVGGILFPLDVQYLPNGRILVAEYHASRVAERDVKTGEVKWQRAVRGPLVAQRLENGNTFVATEGQLLEFNRKGEEVFTFSFPKEEKIMKAMKLANGEIACLTNGSRVVRLDGKGKELRSFGISLGTKLFGGRLHMLPNGRVLVPHNAENKVVEYDVNGKTVWQVDIDQPVAATRLPNGNTLVTTMNQNRAVEFDRNGVEVWQYRSNTRLTRAVRR
jgi:HEAT repeat protein